MVTPRAPREIANAIAVALYGWTPAEAREQAQCVRCRKPVGMFEGWTERDRNEWAFFSGLCPDCWEWITDEEGTEA